jgi:DNA-binding response OmpR family regulator
MCIAIVEDCPSDAELVRMTLEDSGYRCHVFSDGWSLLCALPKSEFSLLIVDWGLPDIPGDRILEWVRENVGWELPVLFVTGRNSVEDITYALELGADDYITKPFDARELGARVKALMRRSGLARGGSGGAVIEPFLIDYEGHRILRENEPVELTPKEFELASLLLRNTGRVVSREYLLEWIWGYGRNVSTRTVDIHVSRVRKKLRLTPEFGWRLTSIYHKGYRLDRYLPETVGESAGDTEILQKTG